MWKIIIEQKERHLGFQLENICQSDFDPYEVWTTARFKSELCQISNKGKIRQIAVSQKNGDVTIQVKSPKSSVGQDGCVVELYDTDGKLVVVSELGKLVLETYKGKPDISLGEWGIACHLDGNKQNNDIGNLKWCTHPHKCNCGTWMEQSKKSYEVPILQLDNKGELVTEWGSISMAASKLGFGKHNIYRCCENIIARSYGFKWSYKVE